MGPVFLCQQFVSSSMQDEWPTVRPASTSSTSLSQITFLLLLHPPPVSTSPLSYLATCSSSACTLSSPLPAAPPPPTQPNPTTTNPAVSGRARPRSLTRLCPSVAAARGRRSSLQGSAAGGSDRILTCEFFSAAAISVGRVLISAQPASLPMSVGEADTRTNKEASGEECV